MAFEISNEDKERIRAEEVFRNEIRKELSLDEKKGISFWSILNSSFFLWFCSSVLISSFTFFFYNWQANNKVESMRKEKIEQIDLEIKSRLVFFHNQRKINNRLIEGLLILEKPGSSSYPAGVYEAFNQRGLRSLLLELSSLLENDKEKQEVMYAIKSSEELTKFYIEFSALYKKSPSLEVKYEYMPKLLYILKDFNLVRWDKPFRNDLKKETQDLPYLQALEELRQRFGAKDTIH